MIILLNVIIRVTSNSKHSGNSNEANLRKFQTNSALVHIDSLLKDWCQFEYNPPNTFGAYRQIVENYVLILHTGSQIEPYGIDYILQRLGFNHARTTIPKWCQRGCMDPLDKILSVIVLKTIQVVKEERKKDGRPMAGDGSTSNASEIGL